jgi:hypothetical protein
MIVFRLPRPKSHWYAGGSAVAFAGDIRVFGPSP